MLDQSGMEYPDRSPSDREAAAIAQLDHDDLALIDAALLSNAATRWRKVARVVGATMIGLPPSNAKYAALPDIFFASRIRRLVEAGRLEAVGDLANMRYCEVRIDTRLTGSHS